MSRGKVTNEELIELVKDGLSVPQIASAKGMADCSVRERLKKLNIQAANGHRATQGYKDEDMRRLAAEGLSQAQIARKLGISSGAVLTGTRRLGLTCADGKSQYRKFTDEQLKALVEQGLTGLQIAYEFDCEPSRVKEHSERLGLRVKSQQELKDENNIVFLQKCLDEGLSPHHASLKYEVAISTICYWEERYGIHLPCGREGVGERISEGRTHSAEKALSLLKERTDGRFRLADGETYTNSHQSYRFFCEEHQVEQEAMWTQIAYGSSGLRCCGEANRLMYGWDSLPRNFVDPGEETWVYLFDTSVDGYCKIGVSNDVRRRANNGGHEMYANEFDRIECPTRLSSRLVEESVLWNFKSFGKTPEELMGQSGWSEVLQVPTSEVWDVVLYMFDQYQQLSVDDFCERYCPLTPLTLSQIEETCAEAGIDWRKQK